MPPEVFYQKKIRNILKETPVLKSQSPVRAATLFKKDFNTDVFLWVLVTFSKNDFEEHRRTVASEETFKNWLIRTFFLESCFQNHLDLVIL